MFEIAGAFSLVPPVGWSESRKGGAIVFKRPERELSVSAWTVGPKASQKKKAASLEGLVKTALGEIGRDAKNPNLIAEVPLDQMNENDLQFWVQSFVTKDTTMLICSSVVRGPSAVLLLTMNAPNKPEYFTM